MPKFQYGRKLLPTQRSVSSL